MISLITAWFFNRSRVVSKLQSTPALAHFPSLPLKSRAGARRSQGGHPFVTLTFFTSKKLPRYAPYPSAVMILQKCAPYKEVAHAKARRAFKHSRNYQFSIINSPLLTTSMIARKLSRPASIFSIISLARISGSGRLSRSARLWSLSQKMSRLVLSRAMISA